MSMQSFDNYTRTLVKFNAMFSSISIIVPTLNEEKYLPKLLKSIKDQTSTPKEIIVADAHSTDKTREVAQSFGCKVIDGGLPSKGRNEGAKVATGDILLFLDADVILPNNFLEETVKKIKNKKLDAVTCFFIPLSKSRFDHISHWVVNLYFYITQKFYPHAQGYCIFAQKSIFEKLGGFDETVLVAEDHDFAKRAGKLGRFSYLINPKIEVSLRRLLEEGRVRMGLKYLVMELYRIFIGEIRHNFFKYEFGNHYKH